LVTETSAVKREDGDYDMHSGMGPMCTMAWASIAVNAPMG